MTVHQLMVPSTCTRQSHSMFRHRNHLRRLESNTLCIKRRVLTTIEYRHTSHVLVKNKAVWVEFDEYSAEAHTRWHQWKNVLLQFIYSDRLDCHVDMTCQYLKPDEMLKGSIVTTQTSQMLCIMYYVNLVVVYFTSYLWATGIWGIWCCPAS